MGIQAESVCRKTEEKKAEIFNTFYRFQLLYQVKIIICKKILK